MYTRSVKSFFISFLLFCFLFIAFPFDAYADSKVNSYTEEQILQTIRNHPEVIIEAIQIYSQQREEWHSQLIRRFSQQIKNAPESILAESPTTGAVAPKVILVEFSDFQCPYCSGVETTLKKFLAEHNNQIALVYKHLPLESIHSEALPAAKAAWAAGKQGKFWEYHDALFEQQKNLSENLYIKIAKSLGLDIAKFNEDRTSEEASLSIQKDIDLAERLEIVGTPFFIMDKEYFSGAISLSDLEGAFSRISLQE